MSRRVLVCGGRDVGRCMLENALVGMTLTKLHEEDPFSVVIEGGARGADWLAACWARRNRIELLEFRADWKTHGKAAGVIRNQQMLVEGKPDVVVAFRGGRGTADMVRRAKKVGVRVIEVAS